MAGDAKPGRWSWTAFGIAALSTLLVLGAAEMAGAQWLARKHGRDARKGWNLVPALRAARALEPGTLITRDAFVAGSIPEQLVTASVVKPEDLGRVLGRRLEAQLAPGEWLTVAAFTKVPLASCASMLRGAALQAGRATEPSVEKLIEVVADAEHADGGTP